MQKIHTQDELYHYGVKGMKWGVRRSAAQLGHVIKKASKSAKNAVTRYAERHRPVSSMSDDELRNRLARLRTELEYKRALDTLHPKKKIKIAKFISDFGSNTVNSISRKLTEKITNAIFAEPKTKKKIDVSDPSKIDLTDVESVDEANKHFMKVNNLLKNVDAYKRSYSNSDQDYKNRVERGEGEVQEALRRMGEMSYDELYRNRNTWYNT